MLTPALTAREAEEGGGAQGGLLAGGGCTRPRRPRRACTRTCSSRSSSASPVRFPCLLDFKLAPELQRGPSCGAQRMHARAVWSLAQSCSRGAGRAGVCPRWCGQRAAWRVLHVRCSGAEASWGGAALKCAAHCYAALAAVSGVDAGSVRIDNGTVSPRTPPRPFQALQRMPSS